MAKPIQIRKKVLDKTKTKEERRREGIRDFTDFYRQNPHRCVSTHFQCTTFTWWQDLMFYLMFKSTVFFGIMTRGIGKSYIIGWFCVVWCTIFPRSRIVIASGTRSQARLIVTQKILGEIYNRYPKVRQEIDIKNSSVAQNNTYVKFYNGSEVVVVTGGDSSRGNRSCIVIYEEARTLDAGVMKNILSKFKQNGDRRPRYKDNPKYARYKSEETKKDLYISSGWMQNHHLYDMCMDAYNSMIDGKPQAVMSLHWGFPVVDGFMDYENDILAEKQKSDYSQMWWAIENEGLFWSESEKSFCSYQQLINIRKIKNPLIPIPHEMYLDTKTLRDWKKKNFIPKQQGEIRILSCDVAVMSNDNTVFCVLRLIPSGDRYKRYLSYIEHANNAHSETQSIRMKQLYEDFDCDVVLLDVNGNGMGISDASSKLQYDSKRDKEYPAWTVFNREDMKDRVFEVDISEAMAVIYGIKQDSKFNHFMIVWLKNAIEMGRLELLVESNTARDLIEDKNLKLDEHQILDMIAPNIETDLLVKELMALEISYQANGTQLKVENPNTRKDRFTALGFSVYYSNILEQKLNKKKKKKSSFNFTYTPPSYFEKGGN